MFTTLNKNQQGDGLSLPPLRHQQLQSPPLNCDELPLAAFRMFPYKGGKDAAVWSRAQ